MQIQNNLIDGALNAGIEKFIFLGQFLYLSKVCTPAIKRRVSTY